MNKNTELNEDLVRHMILNSIRHNNVKFREDWGRMVIASDSANNWRRAVFPYYKAARKKSREQSSMDWDSIFKFFNNVREEIKAYFPYPVIQVEGAEADDVIAAFANNMFAEPLLIISGDKDFIQLHSPNVKQFDPIKKRWIQHDNPKLYLKEHILRGDVGDGVPNVLSDDDTFVTGKRLRPLSIKKINRWTNGIPKEEAHLNILRNYARNEQLIDLSKTPEELKEKIFIAYEEQTDKPRNKIMTYFIKYKLKNLMEAIGDF